MTTVRTKDGIEIFFKEWGPRDAQPLIWNWWRQGMMGGAKAHYDGIVAFSQTDFTEDLKKISIPYSLCTVTTTRSSRMRTPGPSRQSC